MGGESSGEKLAIFQTAAAVGAEDLLYRVELLARRSLKSLDGLLTRVKLLRFVSKLSGHLEELPLKLVVISLEFVARLLPEVNVRFHFELNLIKLCSPSAVLFKHVFHFLKLLIFRSQGPFKILDCFSFQVPPYFGLREGSPL